MAANSTYQALASGESISNLQEDMSRSTSRASSPSNDSVQTSASASSTAGSWPLSPLDKDFPKPKEDINIQDALGRKPGRWTITGQMEANQQREQHMSEEAAKKKRHADFEATKKALLASNQVLQSKT